MGVRCRGGNGVWEEGSRVPGEGSRVGVGAEGATGCGKRAAGCDGKAAGCEWGAEWQRGVGGKQWGGWVGGTVARECSR